MLNQVTNRLRGQVRIRAESAFPERILNLCGAWNLSFWDLRWESPVAFTCTMRRGDWHRLRQAAEKLDCTLTVLDRSGAPYTFLRLRARPALLIGLVACSMALLLSSFFIWQFEITGNHTVPDERILRALEHAGVKRGTFGMVLVGSDIRNQVLLELPELVWLQVNVSGCRAYVEVRERREAPEMKDDQTVSNVVARRSGLVLELKARRGAGEVLPGTVVNQGQLLISGVEDTDTVGAAVLPGQGSVTARTWYDLSATAPMTVEKKRYTGKVHHGLSLVVGTHRVKFFANSSVDGANCDKITTRHPWSLFGIPLPIAWVRETCRFYDLERTERSQAEAQRQLEQVLKGYLRDLTAPYGTVSSTLTTSRVAEGRIQVRLTAECQEEIGLRVPLYQEKPDETVRKTQE